MLNIVLVFDLQFADPILFNFNIDCIFGAFRKKKSLKLLSFF